LWFNRSKGSEARLYVDGFCKVVRKIPYPAQAAGFVSATIGTPITAKKSSSQLWRLGPFYLIEDALRFDFILCPPYHILSHSLSLSLSLSIPLLTPGSPQHVATVFHLGSSYCSNFQDSFARYQTYEIIDADNILQLSICLF
jgi:hypothetical protein